MIGSYGVRNRIGEGKTHQLETAIQGGVDVGMQTFDRALIQLHNKGLIAPDSVLAWCRHRRETEAELVPLRDPVGLAQAGRV